jgi:hypothetical protein
MQTHLVGSAAAKIWFPDLPREPKDYDYFADEILPRNRPDGKRVERFYHEALEAYEWDYPKYASPRELYTIKASHLFWDNRWVKHAKDAIFYQEKGVEFHQPLYDILYPIWVEHYGAKRASLPSGTTAADFFTKTVDRKYDHDSIHASVAYYDTPLFKVILRDGEDVAVSWDKFEQMTHTDKLRLVREEVYATALERLVIPSDYKHNSLHAYRWALQKTITSFWKGKWSLWAVLNLKDLVIPEVDYVQVHKDNSERLILL